MQYNPITRDQYLMNRSGEYPLTPDLETNLENMLLAINKFGKEYYRSTGNNLEVSSGYRPGHYNSRAGGSFKSDHLYCRAVDLKDSLKKIKSYILDNLYILIECGLWLEDPSRTPTWCHLTIKEKSKRIFKP